MVRLHAPSCQAGARTDSRHRRDRYDVKSKRTLHAAVATTTLAAAGLLGVTTSSARQRTVAQRGREGRRAGSDRRLPIGVVTLLMTDVAGSTRLWEERPDVAGQVLERHEALIRTVVHQWGGVLLRTKGEGDSTFSVFAHACAAVCAGVEIQRTLQREPWPDGAEVRVRAASYTGEVELREGDYYGRVPNRCARLRAAAHPGQTVCSQSTAAHLAGLPPEIVRTDLGLYRLRDIARAERIFQLDHRELRAQFPPLRTLAA
jgi:class 3 adenylate cyclase